VTYNFLRGDRDQAFLLPPDLRDWLPADHLAWFILDVVDQLDLQPFLAAYRTDGHGHPAYDPKTLLGVLLYAYAIGVRSSRQIQRRCVEDLAFRVLAGNQIPDHVTIARFRVRHEQALAGFLVASLRLCAEAGLVRLGLVALDGTKVAGNAADKANRTFPLVGTMAPNQLTGDWIVTAGIYSAQGTRLSGGTFGSYSQTVCPPPPTTLTPSAAPPTTDPCLAEFGPDAYNLELFHPADRFWLFQGIETAVFVALAVLLLLAAIHLIRRRIS
jgi:transposase